MVITGSWNFVGMISALSRPLACNHALQAIAWSNILDEQDASPRAAQAKAGEVRTLAYF